MASSPNNGLPPTEILNPNPMDGHQSPDQSHSEHVESSVPESTDPAATSAGAEKRKRDELESGPEADPSHHQLYKTSLCSYFRRHSGSCSHGSACRYAHGEEELRPRPDNTWDPTSERSKKAARLDDSDNNGGEREGDEEEEEEVMMTDIVAAGDDVGEGGGCLDPQLSKCLVHLPRKWSQDMLRKFLDEQGVQFKSAKKKKGMTVGFVNFESAEQLNSALEELEGKTVGNKKLKVADVIPRSYDDKIKAAMAVPHNATPETGGSELDGENANDGCPVSDGTTLKGKSVRDVVTPLAHFSYSEQLEHKKGSIMQMLKKLTRSARKACPKGVSLPEWILKSREIGGLPCELEGILESPLITGYRNKCEFSVGYSLQGKPTVGFMLGNFREGVTAVEEPVDCPNVSSIACKYAAIFQEFLQQSGLPIWNRFKNTGFWRQLTVREGRFPGKAGDLGSPANISEVMLIVQVCTVQSNEELVTDELRRLAHAFAAGAAATFPPLPLTALVLQDHQGISNVAPADAPLCNLPLPDAESGSQVEATDKVVEARIHDYISNLRFSISPTAFFQVNTLAAEKLYSLAGDWAGLGSDTLLFDICCGTGTIGLTLAHRVGMVVGIEMNASAVSDAHQNAEINGITNCRFVCGKAEDVMGPLLKEYLNSSCEKEELPNATEYGDKDTNGAEEKDNSMNCMLDACHEVENGGDASEHSKVGGEGSQGNTENSCTSGSGSSSVAQFKNIVAIVDPPRGGLHPIVLKALRTHSHLRRLVYISCNPETLVANAIELCTPSPEKVEKGNKDNRAWRKMSSAGLARHRLKSMPSSEPFRPVKAMAVDLFPHTTHCEMVMLLERLNTMAIVSYIMILFVVFWKIIVCW